MHRHLIKSTLVLHIAVLAFLKLSPVSAQSAFVDVEVGGDIICAIRDDNIAVCNSGSNIAGRTPADFPAVIDIASGNSAACAVLEGGDLRCFGRDDFGLLNPPTSGAPYKAVATDNSHSCAINKDDGIECWGLSSNGRLDAPAGAFQQLSLSIRQACAVDMNGTVSCWGLNEEGSTDVPTDLPPAQKVVAGAASSCALLVDGSLQCWGRDLPAPSAGPYVDLAMGAFGTSTNGRGGVCGIDTNGTLDCAFRTYDQFGSSPLAFNSFQTPVPTTSGNSSLSMRGATAGCFVTSAGDIDCFGSSTFTAIPTLVDNRIVPATTGLQAQTYSSTTIELMWDGPRDAFNVAGFEIQRDGEVVAITQNGSSYLVDDIVPGEATTFAVRRVSIEGTTGPFSDSIVVLTGETTTTPGVGGGDYQPPARPHEPANLEALVYSTSALELIWDRATTSSIDGYEIRRNGEYIGFTNGTSFFDEVPSADRVYRYDIIPVSRIEESQFYGFSSINVALGGVVPGMCF